MRLSSDGYLNKRLVRALGYQVDFVNDWSTKMFFLISILHMPFEVAYLLNKIKW